MTGDAAGEAGPSGRAHDVEAPPDARPPQDAGAVLLRPARGTATSWSVVGGAATSLAGWLIADTGGHPLAVALLLACVVATYPVLLASVAPGRVAWLLDDQGLVVPRPWGSWSVGWEEIRLARVVRRFGEPALELTLAEAPGRSRTRRLPVGADVERLHAVLAVQLGPTPQ